MAANDNQELICISSDEEDGQEELTAKGNVGKVPSMSSDNQDLKKEDEDKLLDITSDEEEASEMKTNGNSVPDAIAIDEKDENVESKDAVDVDDKDKVKDTAGAGTRDAEKDIESKKEEKIDNVTTEKTMEDPIPDENKNAEIGGEEKMEEGDDQVEDEEDDILESSREKLDLFYSTIKPYLPEEEYEQVETRINKLYNKLELIDEIEFGLIDVIEGQLERFEKDSDSGKVGEQIWNYIKMVVEFMKENEKYKKLTAEEAKSKREKLTLNLETHLKKLEKKIKEWDVKLVDLNQEENSAYMVKARLENKFITYWNLLCNLNNCNSQTDRPIFKKISMEGVCAYPDINNEVETLLNTKKMKLFTPDYIDIKKAVRDVNASKNLNIEDDKIAKLAEDVFKAVIRKVKARRKRDMQISLPFTKVPSEEGEGEGDVEDWPEVDPAELDEDLKKQLEENAKNWDKMKEIEDEFANRQLAEGQEPIEFEDDENLDESESESDDESETSLYECEIGEGDPGDEEKMLRINPGVRLTDAEDDQDASEEEYFDENEGEAEEPEPKRLKLSNNLELENNNEQMDKPTSVDVDVEKEKTDVEMSIE